MTWWLSIALALAAFGEPELPLALQNDPQVVAAWKAARESPDAAARRAAAALLLDRLASIPAIERVPFLLDCQGAATLHADLEASFTLALSEWPEARAFVREALLDGRADDLVRERGVLAAAGWISLDEVAEVEALALALGRAELRLTAAEALRRVTGREFSGPDAFLAWWEHGRTQARAQWLASAMEEQRARSLQHWVALLEREPVWGITAARDPSPAVRRLGYEALARLDPPPGLPADSEPATVLRAAFVDERDPELRLLLVGLVGRFLQGEAAVALLDASLASMSALERLRAIEQLGALRDRAACWDRLTRELLRVYPFEGTPREGVEFRNALWNALNLTLAADPTFAPEPEAHLIGLMLLMLDGLEPEPAVRARQYALLARFPQKIFRDKLLGHAADPARLAQDRAAALESATGMFLRAGETEALRAALPMLLADAAATVRGRAIRSLARLGEAGDLELLAGRLALETEAPLLAELLKALREKPMPALLVPLLVFEPPAELHNDQVRALQALIGNDFAALEKAVSELVARERSDGAYALAYGFAREGMAQELLERHDRMLARTQAEWLLKAGVGGADAARAADALGFLADLERRWPSEPDWPRLQAELAFLLGRTDAALSATERFLALNGAAPAAQRWELGLKLARAAAAAGLYERGWKLLSTLGEVPTAFADAATEVRALFPPPVEPPAPEPEGPEGGLQQL
ncbi:MAG: hypothetical protein O3A20_10570 [Planctomycetota bacterium]|nr:hypothetical protein [Planctomycetota bacterium]